METVEVVIRIPKEQLERLQRIANGTWGLMNLNSEELAILNGTVLPKGHGRLIDADETLKRHCNEMCKYKMGCEEDCYIYDTFHLATTIIEADKEVEK